MPSTAIRQISHDRQTNTLFVTFVDGDLYAYFNVPRVLFDAFGRALSKGRFFAAEVRDRFRYRRLTGFTPPLAA